MLKPTIRCYGWCFLAFAAAGVMAGAGAHGGAEAAFVPPAASVGQSQVLAEQKRDQDSDADCRDPYRAPAASFGPSSRVISLSPCAPERQDLLALDGPGLKLQPLVEPGPAPHAARMPQRIAF